MITAADFSGLALIFLLMSLVLWCAFNTVISKNPMFSVLYLISTFVATMLLLLVLGVEYLAVLLLLIYVGAITILILFVLMMVDIKQLAFVEDSKSNTILRILSYCTLFSFLFFLGYTVYAYYPVYYTLIYEYKLGAYVLDWFNNVLLKEDLRIIGYELFNRHYIAVILISFILFITIVACISLVIAERRYSKRQTVAIQALNRENLGKPKEKKKS